MQCCRRVEAGVRMRCRRRKEAGVTILLPREEAGVRNLEWVRFGGGFDFARGCLVREEGLYWGKGILQSLKGL